jgi:hypothetical protein
VNLKYQILRRLANCSKYGEAYRLAKKLQKKNPDGVRLQYIAAVMYGDDEIGRTKKEIAKRHKKSAAILKVLIKSLKKFPAELQPTVLNEYYWFSHQPYKQYRHGIKFVNRGHRRSFYSQGVGATQLAKKYFALKSFKRGKAWASRAEKAWLHFFKIDSNWYNSYVWYAYCLGLQGKLIPMEKALAKAAKISRRPLRFQEFEKVRFEIRQFLSRVQK